MEVFATSFLPDTLYLKKLLVAKDPVIDIGENFVKQTYRSRCYILSSNGPLLITIPLRKNDSKRVGDQLISYTEDWQTKSLRAIRSSYANSPYFEHYQEEFETLFMSNVPMLHQYNRDLLNWLLKQLYVDRAPNFSSHYINEGILVDYRNIEFSSHPELAQLRPYKQVFTHKIPFVAGLSVIDLLFNKGPESIPFLQ